jgi:F1F0 ATPase subunit 2
MLLAGFYYVADGHWQRLLACALGFVTAKLVVTRLALPAREASHAP